MTHEGWTRRDLLRRTALTTAAVLGGGVLMSACESTGGADGGKDALQAAKDAKTIRIGIANEAPYGFADSSGKTTGEAPEVARAVFKALGIDGVQASVVPFDQLIPALTAKQFDVVAAGMNITGKRCQTADFSAPDFSALTALLVPKGSPQGVVKLEDVAAKRVKVAVLSAAVEKGYLIGAGDRPPVASGAPARRGVAGGGTDRSRLQPRDPGPGHHRQRRHGRSCRAGALGCRRRRAGPLVAPSGRVVTPTEPAVIVSGYDGTQESLRAVFWAAAEADRRDNALLVARALDWSWPGGSYPEVALAPLSGGAERLRSDAEAQMREAVREIGHSPPTSRCGRSCSTTCPVRRWLASLPGPKR
ncbi:transporter substrate-binding domain-containing protein [Amycolatopsis sp. NBC_00355]|uniref:transporter substrate-binding domain-containing protein n=1 Tax=Amycolatopsis sp. NBC_00355 TaxID=2975957 RepID=UPI002E260308